MITNINGIDYFPISANGQTSSGTSSGTLTILSNVFVDTGVFNVGDSCRIKTLFTKSDAASTSFSVSLYWNTGVTTTGAVKLAEVTGVNSLTRAINIERNIRFNFVLTPSPVSYVTLINSSTSIESDIGGVGLVGAGDVIYDYTTAGYYLACAQRTSAPIRFEDTLDCSYIYIDR